MAIAYALAVAALIPAGSSQIRALPTIVEPLRYPGYWYETAAFLKRRVPGDERVAVLPWHLYQPLRVTEARLTANPAPVFFPGRLAVPHDIEIPGRATEITSRYDRIGLAVGREASFPCALAQTLRRLRIRWVLVLDGAESAETMSRLRTCGYSLVEGRPRAHGRPTGCEPACGMSPSFWGGNPLTPSFWGGNSLARGRRLAADRGKVLVDEKRL